MGDNTASNNDVALNNDDTVHSLWRLHSNLEVKRVFDVLGKWPDGDLRIGVGQRSEGECGRYGGGKDSANEES